MKNVFIGIGIIGLLVCGGIGITAYNHMGNSDDIQSDHLVQTCELPPGARTTWFGSDRSFHWTADAIDAEGAVTARYCDGPILRAVRITNLSAGDAVDWQDGAMTDGDRRVVHIDDILTLSTTPVAAERLEGVTLQCIPLLGSCEPTPPVEVAAAPASP